MAATPAGSTAREVVLVIDRSYSMAHDSRWTRAQSAARAVAAQIRPGDRMSVVAFGSSAAQVVEPTSEPARIESVITALRPTSEPTRFAAGSGWRRRSSPYRLPKKKSAVDSTVWGDGQRHVAIPNRPTSARWTCRGARAPMSPVRAWRWRARRRYVCAPSWTPRPRARRTRNAPGPWMHSRAGGRRVETRP